MPHFLTEPYVQSRPYDMTAKMFIPEHIPANAYRRPRAESGVYVLLRRILEDALECTNGHIRGLGGATIRAQKKRSKKLQQETLEWIFSDENFYVFSFLNICDYLYLDAEAIRKQVKESDATRKEE